jgi:photosystem II stability/assembly factor-like uncharacterized protein
VRIFTRNRLVAAACVGAFVAVFAAIGAVSRSSPTVAAPAVAAALPSVPWYWTMVVSPTDSDVLVLGTNKGLYRSGDGGKTWRPTGPKGVNTTSVVQAGKALFVGGVVGTSGAGLIRKNNARAAPDGPAVVATSTDDGKTWRKLHPRGLPNVSVQALAVDPANSAVLYALLNTGALYRSSDGARSFKLVTPKVGIAPWALAVTHDQRFVGGDMDGGSFLSTNAKAWKRTPFTDSSGGRMVMEYAVHPSDTKRVLMTSDGIMMSTDGGKTWHLTLKSDVMFGPVAWAPTKSDVAYAVGFDRSLWRADDAGKTWKKVS